MRRLVSLEKNIDISVDKKIVDFFDPDFIYVPIYDDVIINIEEDDSILINQILLEGTDKYYASTISGKVVGICEKSINGKSISCLEVANDFKEKIKKENIRIKDFKKTDIDELFSVLKKLHLYSIIDSLDLENVKNIVINGVVDEPFVVNESMYLEKYSEEILDTLDFLRKLYRTNNNIVVLKNIESENINSFLSVIGSYPTTELLLLDDYYLLGRNYFLAEKLHLNLKETIFLKPSEIFKIYNAIKYGKRLGTKNITIAGTAIDKGFIVNAKIYSSIYELLSNYAKFDNNIEVVINGLMNGTIIDLKKEIITEETESIFLMKKCVNDESDCINCGKCYEICPVKVDPKYAMDKKIKNKHCINCGLCSYICPANINLRKYLGGSINE